MKPISIFGDYAYEGKVLELVAFDYEGLCTLFDSLERLREDHFCVGFLAYEAYKCFTSPTFTSPTPLAYFSIFSSRTPYIPPKSEDIFSPLSPSWISKSDYLAKVQSLREQIREGNTYQGNLTTTLTCTSTLSSYEIFLSLLSKQDTPYRCFLPTPYGDVISFSPELFFTLQGKQITTKPMKGTMPRGKSKSEDEANKHFLQTDIKNRSENVMIVDLLRNDLSKLATSVQVPHLFEVETYPTLFQMTSTITATLKDTRLFEVFKALFPCGSISGAPKKSTLEILENLEGRERGVYCGALGVVDGESATFSIPIRTFWREGEKLSYGVGSGIVWDSVAESEYEELKTKMRFLSPSFALIESMRSEGGHIPYLSYHLTRLNFSAKALGFSYPSTLEKELESISKSGIVRVELERSGSYKLEIHPLLPHKSNAIVLRERRGRSDLYAFKTTFRPWAEGINYDEVFDVVFYDSKGKLSEGSRSNVILQIGGKLYTPKYQGQFLRGIEREILLERGEVEERELRVEDIKRAEKIFCVNSVRGRVEVNLIEL